MPKIIELRAENTKRLKAVTIRPDGSLVVIGGDNAQGKTSVLDSIAMALGGERLVPPEPIRRGTKKALQQVTLDDGMVIRRTHTPGGGGTLTVASADGAKFPSPQKLLDGLVGRLSFDPLAFAGMEPRKQAETLRELAALDFTALDRQRKELFDRRADANRETKRLEGALSRFTPPKAGAPAVAVSIDSLTEELHRRQLSNVALVDDRKRLEAARSRAVTIKGQIAELQAELDELKTTGKALAKKLEGRIEADEAEIVGKIRSIEQINAAAREAADYRRLEAERVKSSDGADALTSEIEQLDAEKAEKLAAARFPVDALAFDENGVTLNGLPLEQASDAEKLRVSVAIGLAMNPKLKVLLVRNGSLLDDGNLRLVSEMAEAAGAQVWLERVGHGKECTVVIEDGMVAGADEPDPGVPSATDSQDAPISSDVAPQGDSSLPGMGMPPPLKRGAPRGKKQRYADEEDD